MIHTHIFNLCVLWNRIKPIYPLYIHSLIYSKNIYGGLKIFSRHPGSNCNSITNAIWIVRFFFMSESECTFQNDVCFTWVPGLVMGRKSVRPPNRLRLLRQNHAWRQSRPADSGLVNEVALGAPANYGSTHTTHTAAPLHRCKLPWSGCLHSGIFYSSGLRLGGRERCHHRKPPPFQ